MNEREINIIEAAFEVFSRYGVQKSSMNDLAKEAGISRQTLYKSFSNKDDVLTATIRLFSCRAISEIGGQLEQEIALSTRLDIVFEEIVIKPYMQIHASPHADDLIQGMNAASQKEIEQSSERFRVVIEGILKPYKESLKKSNLDVVGLSDLIQKSANAIKHKARDEAHLRTLLENLKKLVLASVEA